MRKVFFLFVFAFSLTFSPMGAQAQSTGFSVHSVWKALSHAAPDGQWKVANEYQRSFLVRYGYSASQDMGKLGPEIAGIYSRDQAELDRFLAQNGFADMRITIPPGGAAVAAVLDVKVDWLVAGVPTEIYLNGVAYPAVQMDQNDNVAELYKTDHSLPIFSIQTMDKEWKVWLIEVKEGQYKPEDLTEYAVQFLNLKRERMSDYKKVRFPMVTLDAAVDISQFKGLAAKSTGFSIDEAVKQIRLKLDDKGARAQSAVAFSTRSLSAPKEYVFERPFLVVFWKEGLALPVFVAYCDKDSWQDPGK